MHRRTLMGRIAAIALAGVFSAGAASAQTAPPAPVAVHNVVLVHGLYADGSSWGKVIPLLQAQGLHVTSVQNPLSGFQDDVDAVKRVLAQQDGPTLLVGHSYAGMVISEAGTDPHVAGLVYIAARAPDAGEDYAALTRKFAAAPAGAGLQWDTNGWGSLSQPAFVKDFAGDLPPAEALAYYAVQQPFARAITTARTTVAAWHDKPTWYAVSRQDRTIDPELQRFMAQRMKASTVELDASHVSLLSQPQAVADLIVKAAQGRR
ncbi:alpha/beta fold hydrolase [Variovorax paradoxus]|uniref:alpha/beta fold hydrolase n=1 Tax=Variovorax paradoxus TaxID=34073 RepID=UPI0019340C5B|nr:alpha/beta hydrolase [Variovorax paradoxus]